MSWLFHLIGVTDEWTDQVDQVDWLFARPAVLFVMLALIIPVTWWIIRRHRRGLPHVHPLARAGLTCCRVCVFLLLMLILAGPYVHLTRQIVHQPVLAIIVDQSASMSLPAGLNAPSRASSDNEHVMNRYELLQATVRQHDAMFEMLSELYDLRMYHVAQQVTYAGQLVPDIDDWQDPALQETALGAALDQVYTDAGQRRMAGVVLFSDGRSTLSPEPMGVIREHLAATDQPPPLVCVPVGDSDPLADVALLDVWAPQDVSEGDFAIITAAVASHALDGRQVTVQLLHDDAVLDETILSLRAGTTQQAQLRFEAQQAGTAWLQVHIEPQPEEHIIENNSLAVPIHVTARQLRVLHIEGYSRWDFRFLDHDLRRDPAMEVTQIMEAALPVEDDADGPTSLARVAGVPEDVAGYEEYDLIILGDVSPQLLPVSEQALLARAVREAGVGLVVQAGFEHMPHAFAQREDQPLIQLLPVTLQPNAPTGLEAPAYEPFEMRLTATGSMHPAFYVYTSEARNRALWNAMPAFYWACATTDIKPGSHLLAQFNAPTGAAPLIAEHQVGKGRVMFIGKDATYLWRQNTGSALFNRFWAQSARHIARDPHRPMDESWLRVQPRHAEPRQDVLIELFVVDADGSPMRQRRINMDITGETSTDTITLASVNDTGLYRTRWHPELAGRYELTFTDPAGRVVSDELLIAASGREFRQPTVDRDAMLQWAQLSRGTLLELDELHALPELIQTPPTRVQRDATYDLWDNWFMLVALVTLYCIDVGIRRTMGLV